MLVILLSFMALATSIETREDGRTHVHSHSTASVQQLLALLHQPHTMSVVDPSVTVKVTGIRGSCSQIDYITSGWLSDLTSEILFCPVSNGLQLSLISSDSLNSYDAQWVLTPDEKGTSIHYSISVDAPFVPQWLLHRQLRAQLAGFFERFLRVAEDSP